MAKTTAKLSEEGPSSPQEVAETMLSWHNLELTSCLEMQSLWAGYGHICAIKARPSCKSRGRDETVSFQMAKDAAANFPEQSFVLKLVQAPTTQPDEGHLRKMYSYEIEQHFYDEIAPTLTVSVAKCLASTSKMRETARTAELGDIIATLMTDLRLAYPVSGGKRAALTSRQVHAALRWLAGFHRCYWEHPAQDLGSLIMPPLEEFERRKESNDRSSKAIWLNGGYTYLATRRKEYEHLSRDKTSEWSALFCSVHEGADQSIAELVAAFLRPCGRPFETYLHGDVKSENMFFTESGDEVAFFDFQRRVPGADREEDAKIWADHECQREKSGATLREWCDRGRGRGRGRGGQQQQQQRQCLDPQDGRVEKMAL
ncbi:hypothetical protein AAL_02715 [Moelleriella libera RCEF 2490]|uniref:Aminoglycoside phosphotransferase domain-containing protein n=1 Tax=Moelleriella libera RCEF 2490 TaxID=1081109 RepID=A0A168EUK8_9HYPO|nr:hypothetical protein AAL_02715 [Moelleriella libera RCEF 2490]